MPDVAQNLDAIAAGSQQNPVDGAFVPGDLTGEDLGSREKIRHAKALALVPVGDGCVDPPGVVLSCGSGQPGQDAREACGYLLQLRRQEQRPAPELPPDRRGRIHDNDIKSLMGMRNDPRPDICDQISSCGAAVKASNERAGHTAAYAVDNDNATYWTTDEGVSSATLECVLPAAADVRSCNASGMHTRRVSASNGSTLMRGMARRGRRWRQGTTIGYKRLLRFPAVTAAKLRLVIDESRTSPTLSTFGLFKAPPRVIVEPDGGGFEDSVTVRLSSDVAGRAGILYAGRHNPDAPVRALHPPRSCSRTRQR